MRKENKMYIFKLNRIVGAIVLSALCLCIITATASASVQKNKGNIAKLCASCHKNRDGVMMGFLENVALKSKTIQMNFLSHKDVVKFTDYTEIKYLKSISDMKNYRGKGFQINFKEIKGEKIATEIIRFNILKVISKGKYKVEKLSLEEFQQKRLTPGVVVYDVRPPMKYKEAHIAGAKPLPAPAFIKFKNKLPKDKSTPIILYGVGGCLSPTVAFKLKQMEYEDVSIFTGGFPEWSKANYSITTPDWLKNAITQGTPHVLIDLRSFTEVFRYHIPGAVNIEIDKLSESKKRFPAQLNAPIIFYGDGKEDAATLAISWGYKKTRILPIDLRDWYFEKYPVNYGPAEPRITYIPKPKPGTVSINQFQTTTHNKETTGILVDVRNPDEFETGTIPGSINIPVDRIALELESLPDDKTIYLFCRTGTRAEMAHTILQRYGKNSQYLDALVSVHSDGDYEIEEK